MITDVIDRLIAAYNTKDLRALVACFAHDCEIYALGLNDPSLHGAQELSEAYREAFAKRPGEHVQILERMTHGSVVVDKERLSDGANEKIGMVIYKVERGLIAQAWHVHV